MKKKFLLEHQSVFLQVPFQFPEKRWFMLVAGYGAGKTSSIVYLIEYLCVKLQGKKDKEGHKPRIMLAGVTLAHLQKTALSYLIEDLTASNSKFFHDKKNNILHVGSVDILITPLQNPESVQGYDCCLGGNSRIFYKDKRGNAALKKIKNIQVGDEVFTRKGWRKVTAKVCNGLKETVQVGSIRLTEDHKVWVGDWKEVRDVASQDKLLAVNKRDLRKIQKDDGEIKCIVKNVPVSFVERCSVLQSLKRLLPARRTVRMSKGCRRLEPVWDITVEGEHEFFTDTCLVHNCACVCDEIDDLGLVSGSDDVTFNAVRAVNERCRQTIPRFRAPFIALASTSQGQKGLYRIYTQFKKTGTAFVKIRARTKDNEYLDPAYVRDLYRMYTPTEVKVFLEGEFLALTSGRVFGDFDWNRNYVNEDMDRSVMPGETLFWSQDFNQGFHRGCVGVLRNGTIYIIKRYEFPEIRDAPRVVRYDFPHAVIKWIPDTTAKDLITHFAKELRKYNIKLVFRGKNPIVEDSVFLVNKLLFTRRLIISRMAKETAEALALEMRDKNNAIPKGVGPSSPVHDTDSVRLMTYYLASTKSELRDIRRVTIARHQEMLENEEVVEIQGSGYAEIPASLIASA